VFELLEDLRAREVLPIPLSEIRREQKPYHVRVHIADEEVERLASAIRATKDVVPIRVLRSSEGYDLVFGLLRLLAVEHLGYETIPAIIEEQADDEALLRLALLEQEIRFPLRHLERGWALSRLQRLREERGLPFRQADLVEATGLDKGTVSASLRAAKVLAEDRAKGLAAAHGIGIEEIAGLGRAQVRKIVGAENEEVRERIIDAACSAIAAGESPAEAVAEIVATVSQSSRKGRFGRLRAFLRRAISRIRQVLSRVGRSLRKLLGRGGRL
jgi:ParB/RepB/Spo0J family partition protein